MRCRRSEDARFGSLTQSITQREITEDTTSPDQLLEAFQGLASDKVGSFGTPTKPAVQTDAPRTPRQQPYTTELDLRQALLPQGAIDYLKASMPRVDLPDGQGGEAYDYEAYLTQVGREACASGCECECTPTDSFLSLAALWRWRSFNCER